MTAGGGYSHFSTSQPIYLAHLNHFVALP
jgi:hypothetical protein